MQLYELVDDNEIKIAPDAITGVELENLKDHSAYSPVYKLKLNYPPDQNYEIRPENKEAYNYLTSIMDKFISEKQQKNDILLMQYKRKLDAEIEYFETEAKVSRDAIISNLPEKKVEEPVSEPAPTIIMDEMFTFDESFQTKEKYVLAEDVPIRVPIMNRHEKEDFDIEEAEFEPPHILAAKTYAETTLGSKPFKTKTPSWYRICCFFLACLHRQEWGLGCPRLFFNTLKPDMPAIAATVKKHPNPAAKEWDDIITCSMDTLEVFEELCQEDPPLEDQEYLSMMLRYSERMDIGSFLVYLRHPYGNILFRCKPVGAYSAENPTGNGKLIVWDAKETAQIQDLVSDPNIGKMRFQWWRDVIDKTFQGTPIQHPVSIAIAHALEKHQLSKLWFTKLIRERETHLAQSQFSNMDQLEQYAENTASSLIYLHLEALGIKDSNAEHAAGHLGKSIGISTILRGAVYQLEKRQFHLPTEIMAKVTLFLF
ncbi:NADH dehydrogenase (ubiquinone) complex I, assembly factor 6 [Terramyces sp. JEL0728]|nr:NADH dehydrogenase (ubiquinone) complex I, assembly factor 6 [Terramyces sp. JEL0728]